jgi:hypothetical protein
LWNAALRPIDRIPELREKPDDQLHVVPTETRKWSENKYIANTNKVTTTKRIVHRMNLYGFLRGNLLSLARKKSGFMIAVGSKDLKKQLNRKHRVSNSGMSITRMCDFKNELRRSNSLGFDVV